jgi:hypothetical protein
VKACAITATACCASSWPNSPPRKTSFDDAIRRMTIARNQLNDLIEDLQEFECACGDGQCTRCRATNPRLPAGKADDFMNDVQLVCVLAKRNRSALLEAARSCGGERKYKWDETQ